MPAPFVNVSRDVNKQIKIEPVKPGTIKKSLGIMYWNVNGLGDKLGEGDFLDILKEHDVIILSETMKRPSMKINLPGYVSQNFPLSTHHNYKKRVPGGFIVCIRDDLYKYIKIVEVKDHVVWISIHKKLIDSYQDLFVGAVYIPHEHSNVRCNDTDYFDVLKDDIVKYKKNADTLLLGDWNARVAQLKDYLSHKFPEEIDYCIDPTPVEQERENVDNIINSAGRSLIDLCKCTGMQILDGLLFKSMSNRYSCWRYNGCSRVDHVTADYLVMRYIEGLEISTRNSNSDHSYIVVNLRRNYTELNEGDSQNINSLHLNRYKWDASKKPQYCKDLNSGTCQNLYHIFLLNTIDSDVGHAQVIQSFYDFIDVAIKRNFKQLNAKKSNKFPKNAWFDTECKNAKFKLHNEIKQNPHNPIIQDLKKEYRRIVQSKKREYHKLIADELDNINSTDANAYWQFWKRHKRDNCSNGAYITSEKFTDHYLNLQNNRNSEFDPLFMNKIERYITNLASETDFTIDDPMSDCLNAPVNENEITHALRKLKNNKAIGLDNIAAEFFKNSDGILIKPLTALFNYIFDSGEYPDAWSTGIINPIHKKGPLIEPDNYRKITILPALGKLFDIIMNNRLNYIKSSLHIEDPLQFGFKPKFGSVDNAFILSNVIDISASRRKPLYVCYVDLKAAFDNINRSALLFKMRNQGIKGKIFTFFRSMLGKSKSTVRWNNDIGKLFDNIYGVLQGGVSSPTLFKLFMEDLIKYLDIANGVQIDDVMVAYLLLADDLALVSETSAGLQKLINGLNSFCKRWHLTVNLLKTRVTIYNKQYCLKYSNTTFVLDGKVLSISDSYDYVGINLSNKKRDKFHENIEKICGKANRTIYAARSLVQSAVGNNLSVKLQLKMFDTQIRPMLEYGIPVWFRGKQIDKIEKVHTTFLKKALSLRSQTCHLPLYADTGRYPLVIRQHFALIKYWVRLIGLSENHVMHKVYSELCNIPETRQNTWLQGLKASLRAAGFNPIEGLDEISLVAKRDTNQFLNIVKYNLEKSYSLTLLESINNSVANPMMRTYKLYKNSHNWETFLSVPNIKLVKILSRFRMGSHNLRIHTGRYEVAGGLSVSDRTCLFCQSSEIDDEYHNITTCLFHSSERNLLYTHVTSVFPEFTQLSNYEKFIHLLRSDNLDVLINLGRYIEKCVENRREMIQGQA